MSKSWPKLERGKIEEVFSVLSSKEKKLLEDYLQYRKARGITTEPKLQDVRRFFLQLKMIIEKDFYSLELKDLRNVLSILTDSGYSEYYKNNIKADLKNFLKYLFKDWSLRFNDFEDLRFNGNARNEEKINASAMISPKDIDKLIKHETKNYWKAFLLTQYEAGLRTKECRLLKWKDINFNIDGDISEVNIYATKTKRSRVVFVEKATHYLKLLQTEQENTEDKGTYIFHSRTDKEKPITKSVVNMWFRRLTKKVLGVEKWNYILRHSRATELYRLAKENKIAKDTAIKFMGHSDDMSSTYTHLDKSDVKKMLKEQVYKIEDLPEEKKHELELKVEEQQKEILKLKETMRDQAKELREVINSIKSQIPTIKTKK